MFSRLRQKMHGQISSLFVLTGKRDRICGREGGDGMQARLEPRLPRKDSLCAFVHGTVWQPAPLRLHHPWTPPIHTAHSYSLCRQTSDSFSARANTESAQLTKAQKVGVCVGEGGTQNTKSIAIKLVQIPITVRQGRKCPKNFFSPSPFYFWAVWLCFCTRWTFIFEERINFCYLMCHLLFATEDDGLMNCCLNWFELHCFLNWLNWIWVLFC